VARLFTTLELNVPSSLRQAASRWRSSSKARAKATGRDIPIPSLNDTHSYLLAAEKRCYLCGAPLGLSKRSKVHMDHKTPLSRGGSADLDNLGLACAVCDNAKGPLLQSEYASLLELLATWDAGAAQSLLIRLRGGYWCYRPAKKTPQKAKRRAQEPQITSAGIQRLSEVTPGNGAPESPVSSHR
jgi:5-methylcytosine-specific restriction endonuclease McrA